MHLTRLGRPIEDRFTRLADEESAADGNSPVLVSLARWQAEGEALVASGRELGLVLTTQESVRGLAGDLAHFSLVAIEVPTFKDGRVFSAARLLRERYSYDGDIRAFGHILPDQALFLARCGVTEIAFAEADRTGAFEAAFRELTVAFQPSRASAVAPLKMRPPRAPVAIAAE